MVALFTTITVGVTQQSNAISNTEIITVHEHYKTETFKVFGNCGMCQKTIQTALKDVDGIKSAKWNIETKMIEVSFNDEKISLKEIKEKIAKVGYDTEEYKAADKAYNSLPGCCQYDRELK